MGIPFTCKVCPNEVLESPQHYLLNCDKTKHAWDAYLRVWQKWGAPDNIVLSWHYILLGELVFEIEDDPPNIQGYHTGGFSYIRQPLDILRSFILYFLWSERCRMHFDVQTPPAMFSSRLGWPSSRLEWPLGKPSTPSGTPGSLVFRIVSRCHCVTFPAPFVFSEL